MHPLSNPVAVGLLVVSSGFRRTKDSPSARCEAGHAGFVPGGPAAASHVIRVLTQEVPLAIIGVLFELLWSKNRGPWSFFSLLAVQSTTTAI